MLALPQRADIPLVRGSQNQPIFALGDREPGELPPFLSIFSPRPQSLELSFAFSSADCAFSLLKIPPLDVFPQVNHNFSFSFLNQTPDFFLLLQQSTSSIRSCSLRPDFPRGFLLADLEEPLLISLSFHLAA